MKELKKERIIDSAGKLFNEEGYLAPSIDRVAEAAGISKMTFYRYFPDKESLVIAILQKKHIFFINNLKSITDKHISTKNKLLSIFEYYNNWFSDDKFHGCMFSRSVFEYGSTSPAILKINATFKSALYELIRDILYGCLKPEPAERVAFIILMLIDGAISTSQSPSYESRENPPAMTAWSAAKAVIYSEGGKF